MTARSLPAWTLPPPRASPTSRVCARCWWRRTELCMAAEQHAGRWGWYLTGLACKPISAMRPPFCPAAELYMRELLRKFNSNRAPVRRRPWRPPHCPACWHPFPGRQRLSRMPPSTTPPCGVHKGIPRSILLPFALPHTPAPCRSESTCMRRAWWAPRTSANSTRPSSAPPSPCPTSGWSPSRRQARGVQAGVGWGAVGKQSPVCGDRCRQCRTEDSHAPNTPPGHIISSPNPTPNLPPTRMRRCFAGWPTPCQHRSTTSPAPPPPA